MQEIKRIINYKYFILVILLLLANYCILAGMERKESREAVIFDEIIKLSNNFKNEENTYKESVVEGFKQYLNYHNIEGKNAGIEEKNARDLAVKKAEYLDDYRINIDEKIENASALLNTDFFSPNSFEKKNVLKSRYDVYMLKDAEIKLSNGVWLEKLFKYEYANLFVLGLLFFTVYGFFEERKKGLIYIINSGACGRNHLLIKRIVCVFVQSVILSVLFYGETAIILLKINGGVEGLNDLALCDESFFLTSALMTRIEFLAFVIAVASLFAFSVAILFWLILELFKNINVGACVFGICLCLSFIIFEIVREKSIFRVLHFLNFYYLITPLKVMEYKNWGYSFGITSVFEGMSCFAAVIIILSVVFIFLLHSKKVYSGGMNFIERFLLKIIGKIEYVLYKLPVFFKEVYKILISQKIVIVLILLIMVACKMDIGYVHIYSVEDLSMLQFFSDGNGFEYGDELEEVLNKYENKYTELMSTLDENNPFDRYTIQFETDKINNIRHFVDYLKIQKSKGVSAKLVCPYEYIDAFGNNQRDNQTMLGWLCVVAAIFVSAGTMPYERKSNTIFIAGASANRNKWIKRKLASNIFIIGLFTVIIYSIYYSRLFSVYEIPNFGVPVKSLEIFSWMPINPSIIGFIVIDIFVKVFIAACISIIVSFLSFRLSFLYSTVVSLLIALPQLLYYLGFDNLITWCVGRYVAVLPVVFDNNIKYMYLFIIFICVLLFSLVCINKKKWLK